MNPLHGADNEHHHTRASRVRCRHSFAGFDRGDHKLRQHVLLDPKEIDATGRK
jgi:hypothetical protein